MKTFICEISVPSGSRLPNFFIWLGSLLTPHRMVLLSVKDSETGNTTVKEES